MATPFGVARLGEATSADASRLECREDSVHGLLAWGYS